MADLSYTLNSAKTKATFKITGLTSPFNTSIYDSAGVTMYPFATQTTKEPSGVIVSEDAPPSGSSTTITFDAVSVNDLEDGRTYYGYVYRKDTGKYHPSGNVKYSAPAVATYTLTVHYVKTSGAPIKDKTIEYDDGTTVYPDDSDIRISISGHMYSYASASSVSMTKNRTLTMYYEDTSEASWSSSDVSSDAVTFEVDLPSTWDSDYYDRIEIYNANTSKKLATFYPSNSNLSLLKVSGLNASTTYTFKCNIVLPSGNPYWIKKNGSEHWITVTTAVDYYSGTIKYYNRRNMSLLSTNTTALAECYPDRTITLTNKNYQYSNSRYVLATVTDDAGKVYATSDAKYTVSKDNFTLNYYLEDTNYATWSITPNYTGMTFTVNLPVAFDNSRYSRITFYNSAGTQVRSVTPSSSGSTTVTVELSGLTSGNTYTIYCVVTTPVGETYRVGGSSNTITVTLPVPVSDSDLLSGCTSRWYNFAAGNRSWKSRSITFEISMGDYPFSTDNFVEAGIIHGTPFTKPSTTAPSSSSVIAKISATSSTTNSVRITYTNNLDGAAITVTAYVKTINGTYMPVPAANSRTIVQSEPDHYAATGNGYQFIAGVRPLAQSFTSGYEPVRGAAVTLKASDIDKFRNAIAMIRFWITDEYELGITPWVKAGDKIAASTYQTFYNMLVTLGINADFSPTFQNVTTGSPIAASNLLALRDSINNFLGALA